MIITTSFLFYMLVHLMWKLLKADLLQKRLLFFIVTRALNGKQNDMFILSWSAESAGLRHELVLTQKKLWKKDEKHKASKPQILWNKYTISDGLLSITSRCQTIWSIIW